MYKRKGGKNKVQKNARFEDFFLAKLFDRFKRLLQCNSVEEIHS